MMKHCSASHDAELAPRSVWLVTSHAMLFDFLSGWLARIWYTSELLDVRIAFRFVLDVYVFRAAYANLAHQRSYQSIVLRSRGP